MNEAGQWRRIYPVQFRQLNDTKKYQKYQWIQADLEKSPTDNRPETYRVINPDELEILSDPLSTRDKWRLRREHFTKKVNIHTDLSALISTAHQNKCSLAVFQPSKWLGFTAEEVSPEWNKKKLAILEQEKKQGQLFKSIETVEAEFSIVNKLPYKFSYRFADVNGRESI